jgi:uncharacterized membrane protein YeaQ/YmgE (transglycosylase-associated protein family)
MDRKKEGGNTMTIKEFIQGVIGSIIVLFAFWLYMVLFTLIFSPE